MGNLLLAAHEFPWPDEEKLLSRESLKFNKGGQLLGRGDENYN